MEENKLLCAESCISPRERQPWLLYTSLHTQHAHYFHNLLSLRLNLSDQESKGWCTITWGLHEPRTVPASPLLLPVWFKFPQTTQKLCCLVLHRQICCTRHRDAQIKKNLCQCFVRLILSIQINALLLPFPNALCEAHIALCLKLMKHEFALLKRLWEERVQSAEGLMPYTSFNVPLVQLRACTGRTELISQGQNPSNPTWQLLRAASLKSNR